MPAARASDGEPRIPSPRGVADPVQSIPLYLIRVPPPPPRMMPRLRAESTSVKLKSKQEEVFEVEKEVACRSVTVKNMVDDTGLDTPVPLPMVDSKILVRARPVSLPPLTPAANSRIRRPTAAC
jgi:hypothetical protein